MAGGMRLDVWGRGSGGQHDFLLWARTHARACTHGEEAEHSQVK
jgi:hypothetical protein